MPRTGRLVSAWFLFMKLPEYAELHCLSNFSFLRGASHAEELAARAQALGYAALAITDECSFAGIVRAHLAAKEAGLKLLIGSEILLESGMKLVLLAQNRAGYGNLSAIISLARRRAGKGSYCLTRGDLARGIADCLALWIAPPAASAEEGRWLAAVFPERCWIAFERHLLAGDRERLAGLRALSAATGLPLVAAGDVHMHVRGRRPLQDMLTALRLNTSVDSAGHALFPNGERHLRTRLQLARLYPPDLLAEDPCASPRGATFRSTNCATNIPRKSFPPARRRPATSRPKSRKASPCVTRTGSRPRSSARSRTNSR